MIHPYRFAGVNDIDAFNEVIKEVVCMETSTEILHHLEEAARFITAPVSWVDLQGRLLGANQAFLEMQGVEALDRIAGKTPPEYLAGEAARCMADHISSVIASGQNQTREEVLCNLTTGKKSCYTSIRSALTAANGQVFGVLCIATEMSQKRAHQDFNRELIGIAEKEAFAHMARKVAHDIQSPLTALSVMLNVCDELNEAKRLILKNTFTAIKDIANNILNRYCGDENPTAGEEQPKAVLCSDFLMKLISERKYQYQEVAVKFDVNIAPGAQFAFIQAQASALGRALTNLVSNAVDAVKNRPDAKISIRLEADQHMVKFTVQDNGKGMRAAALEKILNRTSFTEGKQNGHGLGMLQVWEMVEKNAGKLRVQSRPGQGTLFELTFAKIEKAEWLMDEIIFKSNDILVILDDDQLIHDAWDLRLSALRNSMPELKVRHEKQGQSVLDYLDTLSSEDKKRAYLLCDFELLNQNRHGLQIVEASKLERAALVTSYYANPALQQSVGQMGIKILPKQMASVVPICCAHPYGMLKLHSNDIMYDKNYYAINQRREAYAV